MTGNHELLINQDERVRQVPFASQIQDLAKLFLDRRHRSVIIGHVHLVAIHAREKGLCLSCGLLRRPSRPSTPCAYFVPAMPEDDDLYLSFDGQCLSVDFLHTEFYLFVYEPNLYLFNVLGPHVARSGDRPQPPPFEKIP